MVAVFLEPRVSALLVAGIEDWQSRREDREDTKEGLKSLADEAGAITWEQYQGQRADRELRGGLSD